MGCASSKPKRYTSKPSLKENTPVEVAKHILGGTQNP